MIPRPQLAPAAKDQGAQSGDVPVDDGERVYVAPGDIIAQKYRVDRILGIGGVGFVIAARHLELDGHFAIKFLKRRFLQDRTIVERFTREARAACRIQSEYVARVYDVGSHNGAPFIVMEHLGGRDLAALLAERGAFSVGDATEYMVQACAALAVAHASGIVHRDIKPENLFLVDHDGLPIVKLLDFGISKILEAPQRPAGDWPNESEALTGRLICGTPYYMSPEQVRSTASVDARTDVWSLGMVLYECLAGTTAFVADSIADICAAILEKEPIALSELRADIPLALSDVVARCLRKDPDARYATIAELAVALLPFAPPRALAIAEGSAWIRRAAIQTLGAVVSDDARVSSGSFGTASQPKTRAAITSPRSASPVETPVQFPATLSPRSPKRGVLIGASVAVAALLAAFVAFGLSRAHREQMAEAPAAAKALPPTAPADANSRPVVPEPSDDRAPPAVRPPSTTASSRTPPPPPAHVAPAVHHVSAGPLPVRPQIAAKGSAASPSISLPEPNAPAPTPTPSRPDLGY